MKATWRTAKVTAEEKKQIRELHLQGKHNGEISNALNLNRNSVHRALLKMGLPITRRPPLPEKKVLALLRKGVERRTIGRILHVSQRHVAVFAQAHGFGRPAIRPLSDLQVAALMADILDRRASAFALARKYNCSYRRVLTMAHRILECERFLPTWKNPLSSYFPSRAPRTMSDPKTEATAVVLALVDKACVRFLNGQLPIPATEQDFVKALSHIAIPIEGATDLNGCAREAVRQHFESQVHEAIGTLRMAQAGLVH